MRLPPPPSPSSRWQAKQPTSTVGGSFEWQKSPSWQRRKVRAAQVQAALETKGAINSSNANTASTVQTGRHFFMRLPNNNSNRTSPESNKKKKAPERPPLVSFKERQQSISSVQTAKLSNTRDIVQATVGSTASPNNNSSARTYVSSSSEESAEHSSSSTTTTSTTQPSLQPTGDDDSSAFLKPSQQQWFFDNDAMLVSPANSVIRRSATEESSSSSSSSEEEEEAQYNNKPAADHRLHTPTLDETEESSLIVERNIHLQPQPPQQQQFSLESEQVWQDMTALIAETSLRWQTSLEQDVQQHVIRSNTTTEGATAASSSNHNNNLLHYHQQQAELQALKMQLFGNGNSMASPNDNVYSLLMPSTTTTLQSPSPAPPAASVSPEQIDDIPFEHIEVTKHPSFFYDNDDLTVGSGWASSHVMIQQQQQHQQQPTTAPPSRHKRTLTPSLPPMVPKRPEAAVARSSDVSPSRVKDFLVQLAAANGTVRQALYSGPVTAVVPTLEDVTGVGVLKFVETGDWYMGHVQRGEMHGWGTYTFSSSSSSKSSPRILKGMFEHNVFVGRVVNEESAVGRDEI